MLYNNVGTFSCSINYLLFGGDILEACVATCGSGLLVLVEISACCHIIMHNAY